MHTGSMSWQSLDYLKLVEHAAFQRQIGFKIFPSFLIYKAYFLIVVSGGLLIQCSSTLSCFDRGISGRCFLRVTPRTSLLVTLSILLMLNRILSQLVPKAFNLVTSCWVVVQDSAPFRIIDNPCKSKRCNFNFNDILVDLQTFFSFLNWLQEIPSLCLKSFEDAALAPRYLNLSTISRFSSEVGGWLLSW